MKWHPMDEVEGCGLLEYPRYDDERGFFQEILNRHTLAKEGIPLPWNWAQDNISYSKEGVQRGMHIQKVNPQGKLVTCLVGQIMDVCLDLRSDSPTFMHITRIVLDENEPASFYLPPGTAHGFIALRPSVIHYRCTTKYDAASDGGINCNSPELRQFFPGRNYLRSEKDQALPNLMDYLRATS